MKNRNALLALTLTILLSSCGIGGNRSSLPSSASSEVPTSSKSVEDEKDIATLMGELVASKSYKVEKYYQVVNGDSRADVPMGLSKQFGSKALAQYDVETGDFLGGSIINLDQGVFSYALKDGSLLLGEFEKLSGDKDIDDLYYTPLALSDMSNWTKNQDSGVYTTTNEDYLDAVATISGLTTLANSMLIEFSYAKAVASVEGESITIVMNAYFDITAPSVAAAKIVISDIGGTKDKAVEDYLKNPKMVEASTSWNEGQLAIIDKYYGEDKAIELPFPKGASYALSVVGYAAYQEAMIRDYLSGDLRASYGAQLLRAGYENITQEGDGANVYEKEVADSEGTSTYTLYVSYSSQSQLAKDYGADVASLYPNGLFQIEAVYAYVLNGVNNGTVEAVESWLKSHVSATAFPSLTGAFACAERASIQDDTDGFNAYFRQSLGLSFNYFDAVASATFVITDEQEAKSAISAYLALVKDKGWVNQDAEASDLSKGYYFGDSGKHYGVQVALKYQNGSYSGSVEIAFLDYSDIASEALGE
ncbi:MAG: hypothetical protein J6328_01595 [Bacilli bacterium]|nr:hypothetical protein [Bacilli bacterium]